MSVLELLDSQPELLLVEFLLPSRVPLPSTFEEVHVLLFCHLRVACEEVTAMVEVGDHQSSERVKLLLRLEYEPHVLMGLPLLGEDLPSLAFAHLLNHLDPLRLGVVRLGGHKGLRLGFLSGSDLP